MSAPRTAQRIDEIADRPFVHPRNAGELVAAAGERERRRQRSERGAGIAEEQLRRLDRDDVRPAPHQEIARRRVDARRAMPSAASASSIRSTSSASSRPRTIVSPCGERGEQQRAIGNALRAGQRDGPRGARHRREIEGFRPRRRLEQASRRPARYRSRGPSAGTGGRAPNVAPHARRAADARANTRFERRRRRRRPPSRRPRRAGARYASISASSASRLASEMSRHISGEPAAMRVKSRKPLAA